MFGTNRHSLLALPFLLPMLAVCAGCTASSASGNDTSEGGSSANETSATGDELSTEETASEEGSTGEAETDEHEHDPGGDVSRYLRQS